jgi:hypothetical protein
METSQQPSALDHNIINPTPSVVRCAPNSKYEYARGPKEKTKGMEINLAP